MTSTDTRTTLLHAAEQTFASCNHDPRAVLHLAEAANILESPELARDLLAQIRGITDSEAGKSGELPPDEVAALARAFQLLKDYDTSAAPHLY